MSDTIAAIATALSPSAIGILRLSGPDTKAVLDAVFFPLNGKPMSQQAPRTMVLGRNDRQLRQLLSAFMREFAQRGENRRLHIYTDCNLMD